MTTNPVCLRRRVSAPRRIVQAALIALAAIGATALPISAADNITSSSTGVISGIVTNKTTGNGLMGAKVEIPRLNVSALVDNTGRYVVNVPPGNHEVVVSYTGLDSQSATVSVNAGQPVIRDFVMSSAVLMLDAFKVASEKEGQ